MHRQISGPEKKTLQAEPASDPSKERYMESAQGPAKEKIYGVGIRPGFEQ